MREEEEVIIPVIKISDVLEAISNGVTRCEGDKNYSPERGSIQERYGLTKAAVIELFKHPKLVGKKVIVPKFQIIDDTDEAGQPVEEGDMSQIVDTNTAETNMDTTTTVDTLGTTESSENTDTVEEVEVEATANNTSIEVDF